MIRELPPNFVLFCVTPWVSHDPQPPRRHTYLFNVYYTGYVTENIMSSATRFTRLMGFIFIMRGQVLQEQADCALRHSHQAGARTGDRPQNWPRAVP